MIENLKIVLFAIILFVVCITLRIGKLHSQVSDYDGNKYKTVTIGKQVWMVDNLNVEHYRNGDIIPQVQNKEEWASLSTGAWCYYENQTENGVIFGKLYNWYAVDDARGLAPDGWHIPEHDEWKQLAEFLGGHPYLISGGKLKATTFWESPNEGATNSSGFTAFPGGFRNSEGKFEQIFKYGCFWSASWSYLPFSSYAWYFYLSYGDSNSANSDKKKKSGLSVRCVKD